MAEIQGDAWNILNDDERTALSLSLSFNKSTWESGEIMSKAHFKYLEIQKRAKKFLEIFTNHFLRYHNLFPSDLHISFAFKEYLTLTIIERKNISQATKLMEDQGYLIASRRNKLIIRDINKLRDNNHSPAQDLYNLIMDFDRWNNFRILPLEIQEPSAFKRRNKARNIKHIRNITSLPQYSVLTLISTYQYSGKKAEVYLPVISDYLQGGLKVIAIRNKPVIIKEVTDIGFFVFDDRAKASDFAGLVYDYFLNSVRNCKTGQRFWPEFRVLMAQAINHKELEHIHKSRTYLDSAIINRDELKLKKRKQKKEKGEKRANDDQMFY